MYLIIIILSLLFTIFSYKSRKLDNILFLFELIFLTFFICFRYGQGTDFFNYERMYEQNMVGIDWYWLFNNNIHGEIGYKVLSGFARYFGLPFYKFLSLMSLLMMILTCRGIKLYSLYKTFSLSLFIPTFFFSYYIGIIREGIILSIVIGILLPCFINKSYIRYCLIVLFCSLIHKYSVILYLPLFFDIIKFGKTRRLQIILSFIMGIFLWLLLYTMNFKFHYIRLNPSYGAIMLRIVLFFIITQLYKRINEVEEITKRLYKFYIVGFIIYVLTCSMSLVSHRISAYMKISEIILLPRLVKQVRINANLRFIKSFEKFMTVVLVLMILFVEGVKNIRSYIQQGEYYDFVNVVNFPYITIFNQNEIFNYRYDISESINGMKDMR